MSPHNAPARTHSAPVYAGRMMLLVGLIAASTTTTITTGTGTTGFGQGFVRR